MLEAQASGLPVIVTNSGGPRENIIHGKTGLIVEAGDVGSLLHALETLISDTARLKEMGKAARLHMENRSYEEAFEETWRMYQGNSAQLDSAPAFEENIKRKAA